ncbi:D-alanine--D-alanyl carrier protein ligase [Paraburkholderia nemoris]|uniref:AMP-binding protein n=1 Tax=Paraburkholderia nemoris TaxID=2793076 RepID=UPI00190CD236|nr:AMP-binding protein [Paraburkholderia nemoris]MBK3738100.1 D-alanine--poly(phosphoribitol) ligase [Paraburkholderia aspalathi]CAE6818504.1 D-alanine--D-alanyl carrier protein ligase [Paraburkholderia nemoris]CAE6842933.1 D-alanine--D-alanyl carrier protein ligase [Paraburkholderia nemoris]
MRFDLSANCFADTDVRADAWAVIGADRTLRWHELAEQAHAWAALARAHGFAADVPVIIRGHKEAAFFVAMVGALLLGAPFVPVDTIYPDERMQRIASTLGAQMYFDAHESRFVSLNGQGVRTRSEAAEGASASATASTSAVSALASAPPALREKNLAYVLFTSGTTGEPKGVQIGRESVTALTDWMAADFALGDAPVFLNQAPFSFDLSMYEVFGTLALGGTVVLASRALTAQGAAFLTTLARHGMTTWVSTPSFAQQQLLNPQFSQDGLPALRTFLFCGEVLPVALARQLRQRFPSARIINTYGPTEATVATTWIVVDDAVLAHHARLPIGHAKRDAEVFVDDGELCIAGAHVMRGYLNREDLNAARMFTHNGQRAFRTGDLGAVDSDGLLFCHGRIDDQIKMGGYRIELMEIDAALRALPGAASAAAVPLRRPDGSVARVVAFVATGNDDVRLPDALHDWKTLLAARLPSYMIPSELLACRSLPVSVNFKIDRAQLAQDYRDVHFKAQRQHNA